MNSPAFSPPAPSMFRGAPGQGVWPPAARSVRIARPPPPLARRFLSTGPPRDSAAVAVAPACCPDILAAIGDRAHSDIRRRYCGRSETPTRRDPDRRRAQNTGLHFGQITEGGIQRSISIRENVHSSELGCIGQFDRQPIAVRHYVGNRNRLKVREFHVTQMTEHMARKDRPIDDADADAFIGPLEPQVVIAC